MEPHTSTLQRILPWLPVSIWDVKSTLSLTDQDFSGYTQGDMVFYAILQFVMISQSPVITEIAPNPFLEISGEFVEIYNSSSEPLCLGGYSITDGDALDELLPWDEGVHGPFPHTGMILGTDTIPPEGFALVFELDYPDAPVYEIPAGTLILTTGDHAICNGLAASSDPLTLYNDCQLSVPSV